MSFFGKARMLFLYIIWVFIVVFIGLEVILRFILPAPQFHPITVSSFVETHFVDNTYIGDYTLSQNKNLIYVPKPQRTQSSPGLPGRNHAV